MMKRLLSLLLALLLIPAALAEEGTMTDEQITRLLWEMYQTENGDAEYLVLPEEYEVPPEGKTGIYNLLLLGIDNPTDSLKGRSDTMLLASLNAYTGRLKLVSFLRDTYVSIPRHGHNKLNAAYSYGGADLLLETLGKSFGVHVDGYVAVNYALMAALVDAIGGVELEVSEGELKKLNGILEYYNYLRVTGLQTMSFARIRKLDSDFMRVQRQQKVVLAIYRKLRTLDALTLTGIITEYIGKVGTNVTLAQAAALVAGVLAQDELTTETLRIPKEGAYTRKTINDTYFVVPNLDKCRKAISAFLYGQEE